MYSWGDLDVFKYCLRFTEENINNKLKHILWGKNRHFEI